MHQLIQGGRRFLDALERHAVRYLVIGAAAAEALGWSGRSEDIDIVPETSEPSRAAREGAR